MKIAGIIAEYNPLHDGHRYQLTKTKEALGADYIIVAMSGSFTQRGIPAFFDKFKRAEAALDAGADLVVELPTAISTGSSEYFAAGGVRLLDKLCINYLSFGSEAGDIKQLNEAADFLLNESDEFKTLLKNNLKKGLSFPLARSKAISELNPSISELISSPNNILGIEYIKAIKKYSTKVEPYTIRRLGQGYNDASSEEFIYPSSSRLRAEMINQNEENFLIQDDFSILLADRLRDFSNTLTDYADVSDDLALKIRKRIRNPFTFSSLADDLKSKDIAMTRVDRALIHIMLGIKQDEYDDIKNGAIAYARILGMKKSSSTLLKYIKENSDIKLITKPGSEIIKHSAEEVLWSKENRYYNIYRDTFYLKTGITLPDDYGMLVVE